MEQIDNNLAYDRFKKIQSKEDEEIEKQLINLDINNLFKEDYNKFIGEFQQKKHKYKIKKGYIDGKGEQIRLYFTKFEPKNEAICSISIIHGFGDYSGRLLHVADYLVQQQMEVNLLDLRGFGYSGGPRASCTIKELHYDIETLIQQSKRNIPHFILAFSMGALLINSFLINNPLLNISGVILSNPLIKIPRSTNLNGYKGYIVKLLAKDLKDLVINSMINISALTKDSYHIMKIVKDRLVFPFMSFSFVKQLLECTEYVNDQNNQFNYPLLMLLGEQDGVLEIQHSQAFFKKIKSQDK